MFIDIYKYVEMFAYTVLDIQINSSKTARNIDKFGISINKLIDWGWIWTTLKVLIASMTGWGEKYEMFQVFAKSYIKLLSQLFQYLFKHYKKQASKQKSLETRVVKQCIYSQPVDWHNILLASHLI